MQTSMTQEKVEPDERYRNMLRQLVTIRARLEDHRNQLKMPGLKPFDKIVHQSVISTLEEMDEDRLRELNRPEVRLMHTTDFASARASAQQLILLLFCRSAL